MNKLILLLLITLTGCSTFKPQDLDYSSVPTGMKKRMIDYGVYTPPGYQSGERLPMVLLLHGGGGSHQSFEKYKANEFFDQKIQNGEMPRVLVVTPNGDFGLWENWYDGSRSYRDWVMRKVLPQVIKDYDPLPCPENCYLAGISMGGFGVLRFAYFERDSFSAVSAISASIYSDEQIEERANSWLLRVIFPIKKIFGPDYTIKYKKDNPYNAFVDDEELRQMRLQLIWGNQDHERIIEANEAFHKKLTDNNVQHDKRIYQGKHKWVDWVPNFDTVINFLVETEG